MRPWLLLLALAFSVALAHRGDRDHDRRCRWNDLDNYICSLNDLHDVTSEPNIPSGAPPTNDGFAYSQLSYTDTFLYIAGQNGYDTCGRLVPRDYDYTTGKSHSLTRIAIAFLNVAAITECFNMNITQVPAALVTIANTWNDTRLTPEERVQAALDERSLVNWVQIYFWGFDQPKWAREYTQSYTLSRGDTFEVQPMPVPRVNATLRTCLQTGHAPRSAQILKTWTETGNPPADMAAFLLARTGYRLGRGLGPCSNPELRNDDWSVTGLPKAPRFGDNGDLLQAEPWLESQTRCVAIPARPDVPAANFFVRTQGLRRPGQTPIVLIHGTSASHSYWRGTQRLLSRRYYTINIDLRGHGQSQVTPALPVANATFPFRYTYDVFAGDVRAILTALGVEEPVVCAGISIGASICVQLAADFPGVVERNVLVSGAPLFRCQDGTVNGSVPTCSSSGQVPWLTAVPTTPVTLLPEDVAGLRDCDVTDARAKIDQNRAANTSGVAVQSLINYAQKVDQTSLLASVRVPTLVIHGLADGTLGLSAAQALVTGIKNAVRADFVGRGHLLPITSFVDVANIMLRFVQGNALPEVTTVLDSGCQVAEEVAPEANFAKCPSV